MVIDPSKIEDRFPDPVGLYSEETTVFTDINLHLN